MRDSNPRGSFPPTSLAGTRFRPLSQLSVYCIKLLLLPSHVHNPTSLVGSKCGALNRFTTQPTLCISSPSITTVYRFRHRITNAEGALLAVLRVVAVWKHVVTIHFQPIHVRTIVLTGDATKSHTHTRYSYYTSRVVRCARSVFMVCTHVLRRTIPYNLSPRLMCSSNAQNTPRPGSAEGLFCCSEGCTSGNDIIKEDNVAAMHE